jgi:addiction module RelB/DinJ family antitoxin
MTNQEKLITISFEVTESEKKSMELLCENMGINVEIALKMFARALINNMGIPFDVVTDFIRTPRNVQRAEDTRAKIVKTLNVQMQQEAQEIE